MALKTTGSIYLVTEILHNKINLKFYRKETTKYGPNIEINI
jgi:hypothetical protein